MDLFSFGRKEEKDGSKGLGEIKRLALGGAGDNGSLSSKSAVGEQLAKSVFDEEQRIFTQVSSIKELSPGEQNYSVPKELIAPSEEKKISQEVFVRAPRWKARGEIIPKPGVDAVKDSLSESPVRSTSEIVKESIGGKQVRFGGDGQINLVNEGKVNLGDGGQVRFGGGEQINLMNDGKVSSGNSEQTKSGVVDVDSGLNKSAFDALLKMASSSISTVAEKEPLAARVPEAQVVFQAPEKRIEASGSSVLIESVPEPKPVIVEAKPEEKNIGVNENKPEERAVVGEVNSKKGKWGTKERLVVSPEEPQKKEVKKIAFFSKHKEFLERERAAAEQAKSAKTPVDEMFVLLEKYNKIDVDELSGFLKLAPDTIEKLARIFEGNGIIEIDYPTSLTKKPILILKNPPVSRLTGIPFGKILEAYKIELDYVPAQISIVAVPNEARPVYAIELPAIGVYTRKFLNFIKDEVAETMPIELEEILDPKKAKLLKERFFSELTAHLSTYFPQAPKSQLFTLSGMLLHEMYGLGDIELLLGDDMLEEVSINSSKTPITIYHRVHGWLKTNLMPGSEEEINNFASQIGRKIGREITTLSPILDAHLLSGDRVNATLFPISSEGNTITIRRFARKPWTLIDFIGKAHTMSAEMAATLWLAMQYEMNILIAGGTASGKTSALNTLLALVPTYHRIISIEDVREIVLPKFLEWNWVPMVTRSPNPEGMGEVTMLDLMVTSLRMRPDRIIVGEIRRKKEAEVLMEAIETGHSIYSTIHANSGYQVLRRLAEAPISIPLMQIELIDLIVVQYRDRKTNKRRTFEISEIEQTSTGQGLQINTIFKWSPRTDSWDKLNKPTKLITLLNLHTGMTEEDIVNEINDRTEVLEWMRKNNITDLNKIGYLVKLFYSDAKKVKGLAKHNVSLEEIDELIQADEAELNSTLNKTSMGAA